MHHFPESKAQKNQAQLAINCKDTVYSRLETSYSLINEFAPNAVIPDSDSNANLLVTDILKSKIPEIKLWLEEILDIACQNDQDKERKVPQPRHIIIPNELAIIIIQSVIDILSCNGEFTENHYYYISHIGQAMGIEPTVCLKMIERQEKQNREIFFNFLLDFLQEDVCFQCAVLFYRAIQADQQIHPAEFKYMRNINQLLKHDPIKMEALENSENAPLPKLNLNKELSAQIFSYLVEIVLCDQNYDPQESKFLNQVYKLFGFTSSYKKKVMQSVGSLILLKSVLFSNSE